MAQSMCDMENAALLQEVPLSTQHDILGYCAETLAHLAQHDLLFTDRYVYGFRLGMHR